MLVGEGEGGAKKSHDLKAEFSSPGAAVTALILPSPRVS